MLAPRSVSSDAMRGLDEMFRVMHDVARYSAAAQMLLLLSVTFSGSPGLYRTSKGFMYVSQNFCTKPALGTLFIVMTLPTWTLLTCSLALEPSLWKRRCLIFIMSLPMSTGLGIIFFSLCETHYLHYLYVNTFVASVGCIHFIITITAAHVKFLQAYYILLCITTICSVGFVFLAAITATPGTIRNVAVGMEYMSVLGFVLLNCLVVDRIREHITPEVDI